MKSPSGKPLILIGPLSNDPAESVSTVNRAFVQGLAASYGFVLLAANRKHGGARQAMFNWLNMVYFAKHLSSWLIQLLRRRPCLAHYALNSGWAMEKSLAFLQMARFTKARTLGHLHGGSFLEFWKSLPDWRRRRAASEFRQLDGLVVLSERWRRGVIETLNLPENRVFVVNNPLDPGFEQAALAMPIAPAKSMVLCMGVMEKAKGVFDILDAAKIVRERVKAPIVLAGPEREPDVHRKVLDYIETHSLKDTVSIRGAVWGSQKMELFQQASILLLPSYAENFPLVVLEAAAAGLAIVATPVGAVPEFFEDGKSALFVEPGNARQIAAALLRLLENPEERVRLAREARQVFTTRLCRERIMSDMDQVYQTILSRPKR